MSRFIGHVSRGILALTILSGLVLSSIRVSADEITRVSNVTVSVPASCNISGENTTHSANVSSGTYQTDIGLTTLTVFCNDAEGFSIYAIGFSNQEYGNTKLLATVGGVLSPSNDIVTGTATGSNANDPSNWAMKLKTPTSGDTAIIVGSTGDSEKEVSTPDFSTYVSVPSNYTRVAYKNSTTDVTNGTKVQSTYAAYISPSQPAGDYDGKVKYTLVHPASEGTPTTPQTPTVGCISYYPNASGVTDTMGDQCVDPSATEVEFWASNFQRQGYGFAGWSTTHDYSDSNGFYGPNETTNNATILAKIQSEGLSLYAHWIKTAGSLQGWNGCGAMSIGDVTALTDQRDNDTYAVAKLADGKCWMIENLRLDYTNSDNSTGVLSQGYGGLFVGLAEPEAANRFTGSPSANSLYYSGTQSGTASIDVGSTFEPQVRIPRYNNNNTANAVANMTTPSGANIYSYGNYYNWPAAMANTEYFNDTNLDANGFTKSEAANTSICPTGWKLPYGGDTNKGNTQGGYYYLNYKINNDSNVTDASAVNKLKAYPNNFIRSGYTWGSSISGRGSAGEYLTSTLNWSFSGIDYNFNDFYYLFMGKWVAAGTNQASRYNGISVRCVSDS